MQVFVIIPMFTNNLQDGLVNVADVGILLLKVSSVDTRFLSALIAEISLCLDSRDSGR